jgi:superfamily II DNA or RNA helicase
MNPETTLRPYQQTLHNTVLSLLNTGTERVVLAAEVGAGKTNITFHVIASLLAHNPATRILVLTHNRRDIRAQFGNRLLDATKTGAFPFTVDDVNVACGNGDYDATKRICVTLPNTVKALAHYDVLVFDEAHHIYLAETVQNNVLSRITAPGTTLRQLLLTATPSAFMNDGYYALVPFSGMELHLAGKQDGQTYIEFPTVEFVEAYRQVTGGDYRADGTTKQVIGKHLSARETRELVRTVVSRLSVAPTLWIGTDIQHAQDIASELERQAPGRVLVSESDTDVDGSNLNRFAKESHWTHLVVVDRGTLAWDCPKLENLVDVSMTLNPELRKQQMGRVMRPFNGTAKHYIVVSSPERRFVSDKVQALTIWLFSADGLSTYSGLTNAFRNLKLIPVVTEFNDKKKKVAQRTSPVVSCVNPLDMLKAMAFAANLGQDVIRLGRNAETYRLVSWNEIANVMEGTVIKDVDGRMARLRAFITAHGHLPSKGTDGYQFALHVQTGIVQSVSDDDRAFVNNTPSEWTWQVQQQCNALRAYVTTHGHLPPVPKAGTKRAGTLGAFAGRVKNTSRPVTDEFVSDEFKAWVWSIPTAKDAENQAKRDANIAAVYAYYKTHGQLPSGSSLGNFVHNVKAGRQPAPPEFVTFVKSANMDARGWHGSKARTKRMAHLAAKRERKAAKTYREGTAAR